jgi:hypothetical protein
VLASDRVFTVTNTSAAQSPVFYLSSSAVTPTNDGAPEPSYRTLSGQPWCATYQTLPPGGSCDILVGWHNIQHGGPHAGNILIVKQGGYEILHSEPITMGVTSRAWFDVTNKGLTGYSGIVAFKDVTLTNIGNVAADTTNLYITAASGAVGDGGFRIKPGSTCTVGFTLIQPGETCEVRIEFCKVQMGTFTDGWQIRASNGVETSARSEVGVLTAVFGEQQDLGDTCSGFTSER